LIADNDISNKYEPKEIIKQISDREVKNIVRDYRSSLPRDYLNKPEKKSKREFKY